MCGTGGTRDRSSPVQNGADCNENEESHHAVPVPVCCGYQSHQSTGDKKRRACNNDGNNDFCCLEEVQEEASSINDQASDDDRHRDQKVERGSAIHDVPVGLLGRVVPSRVALSVGRHDERRLWLLS